MVDENSDFEEKEPEILLNKSGSPKKRGKRGRKRELTPMMIKFIDQYLISPNAAESCRLAGYSHKTANVIGYKLLKNPLIADSIRQRRAQMNETSDLTRDFIIQGIKKTIKKAGNNKQRSVEMRGWELLGKMEGSLDSNVKKIELTGKDGGAVVFADLSDKEIDEQLQREARLISEGKSPLPN